MIMLMAMLVLLIASHLLPGSVQSLQDKDDVSADLLDKLTSKKVVVFAAGHVSGIATLFISGTGGKTDFSGGYQLTVKEDPADGRFSVDNGVKLVPKYSSITATEVMFVCSDSAGSSLVTMSKDSVGALSLSQNKFTKLNMDSNHLPTCFLSGQLHFSANELKTFYALDPSSGNVTKNSFDDDSISSSTVCVPSPKKLGHLCASKDKISLSSSCSGSPPSNIISGYVGSENAYLFSSDNTVYYFKASIFAAGGETDLKTASSSQAWFSQSSLPDRNKSHHTTTDNSKPAGIWIFIVILIILLICGALLAGLIICWCRKDSPKDKKGKDGKGGKDASGKNKEASSKSGSGSSKSGAKSNMSGKQQQQPNQKTVVGMSPSAADSQQKTPGSDKKSSGGGGGSRGRRRRQNSRSRSGKASEGGAATMLAEASDKRGKNAASSRSRSSLASSASGAGGSSSKQQPKGRQMNKMKKMMRSKSGKKRGASRGRSQSSSKSRSKTASGANTPGGRRGRGKAAPKAQEVLQNSSMRSLDNGQSRPKVSMAKVGSTTKSVMSKNSANAKSAAGSG